MRLWHIVALLLAGATHAAEPVAQATLGGMRCIYSPPHDESGRRMELRVVVSPMEQGWQVNEAGSRAQRIRGTDNAGNTLTSAPCAWGEAKDPGARTAYFVFPLSGRVDYLLVDEVLQVQLARDLRRLKARALSMLTPTELPVPGGGHILSTPDSSNAEETNRDADGSLLRADLTLTCPPGVSILRAVRVWTDPGEKKAAADQSFGTQDLEVRHSVTRTGKSVTRIVLWNAAETEHLELELCSGQVTVHVPMRFRAMLGDRTTQPVANTP